MLDTTKIQRPEIIHPVRIRSIPMTNPIAAAMNDTSRFSNRHFLIGGTGPAASSPRQPTKAVPRTNFHSNDSAILQQRLAEMEAELQSLDTEYEQLTVENEELKLQHEDVKAKNKLLFEQLTAAHD